MKQKRMSYPALAFAIGFTSLVYEIYSTRVLFLFIPQTDWAITIAISAFLAGLAFSSLFFVSFIKKQTSGISIIWMMQVAVALYAFFILRHYDVIPLTIDEAMSTARYPALLECIKLVIMWIFLFIPAFCIGGSFPILNGLFMRDMEHGAHDTGILYFWDTLGGIVGALLTGFLFLPYLGFLATILLAAFCNIVIAIVIAPTYRKRALTVLITIIVAGWGILSLHQRSITSTPHGARNVVDYPELDARFGTVLFQEQSPFGKVTVGNNALNTTNNKALFINYRPMCTTANHSSENEVGSFVTAHLRAEARVLNIGLGCGFTAHTLESQDVVSELSIVEINPIVAKAAQTQFGEENGHVLESVKTTLQIEDGAEFLRTTADRFDAIVIDIEEVSVIHSSPLYTQEYFALARTKLKPGGILSLWAGSGNLDYAKIFYNTLHSAFPYVHIRLLANNTFLNYYASDTDYDFEDGQKPEEAASVAAILHHPLATINTLDNRIIERFFNTASYFSLPRTYSEPFVRNP